MGHNEACKQSGLLLISISSPFLSPTPCHNLYVLGTESEGRWDGWSQVAASLSFQLQITAEVWLTETDVSIIKCTATRRQNNSRHELLRNTFGKQTPLQRQTVRLFPSYISLSLSAGKNTFSFFCWAIRKQCRREDIPNISSPVSDENYSSDSYANLQPPNLAHVRMFKRFIHLTVIQSTRQNPGNSFPQAGALHLFTDLLEYMYIAISLKEK